MKRSHSLFAVISTMTLTSGAMIAACSGDSDADSGSSNSGSGAASSGGAGAGGSGGAGALNVGAMDGGLNADSACATQSSEATLVKKPVDVIIVIDNSGSMTIEIEGVQDNINTNFANIIEASGIDYRVIMLTRHGSASNGQSVCIEAPLSGIPAGGCVPPPGEPVNNPPKFFHYSVEIGSHNSLCRILETFDTADENNFAPNGWSEWLRDDSYKVFIELTDDGVSCGDYNDGNNVNGGNAVADAFDADLLALSPAHFGTADERNYAFYSIVAMAYNDPPTQPYLPTDPIITDECPTSADNGTGYQALSNKTGALRFPLCDTTSYGPLFQEIAAGVIEGAEVACEFPVPEPPNGEEIDLASVVVEYTPGSGAAQSFTQVADASACTAGAFYIEDDVIYLCPETCTVVQSDEEAAINVLFACSSTAT